MIQAMYIDYKGRIKGMKTARNIFENKKGFGASIINHLWNLVNKYT